jgi:micrococcal nuclease
VTQGEDRAGQIIGDVFVRLEEGQDEKLLNVELVERGWAWHFVRFAKDNRQLSEAEQRARAGRLGLWAEAGPVSPWDFRRQQAEAAKSGEPGAKPGQ